MTLPLICRQETLAQRGKATWPRSHSHQEAEPGLVSWFPVPGLFWPQTYRMGGPGEGWEAKSLGSMCESLTPIVMGEMTGCSFLQNLNYEDCMREKQPSHEPFPVRAQMPAGAPGPKAPGTLLSTWDTSSVGSCGKPKMATASLSCFESSVSNRMKLPLYHPWPPKTATSFGSTACCFLPSIQGSHPDVEPCRGPGGGAARVV